MDKAALKRALEDPASDTGEGMERLAGKVREESLLTSRNAVALWQEGDKQVAPLARELLSLLSESALEALLGVPDSSDPGQVVWLISTMAALELEARRKVVDRIIPLLARKTPVPKAPVIGPLEEPVPDTRVCDEAYLLLRRLINGEESLEAYHENARTFTGLTEDERDEEISKAQQQRAFTSWDRI